MAILADTYLKPLGVIVVVCCCYFTWLNEGRPSWKAQRLKVSVWVTPESTLVLWARALVSPPPQYIRRIPHKPVWKPPTVSTATAQYVYLPLPPFFFFLAMWEPQSDSASGMRTLLALICESVCMRGVLCPCYLLHCGPLPTSLLPGPSRPKLWLSNNTC